MKATTIDPERYEYLEKKLKRMTINVILSLIQILKNR